MLHESPILTIPGVSMLQFFIDLLHTWHLGPLQAYIAMALWLVLDLQPWGMAPHFLDAEDAHRIGLMHLKGKLRSHYTRRRATDEDWNKKGSEVVDIIKVIYT